MTRTVAANRHKNHDGPEVQAIFIQLRAPTLVLATLTMGLMAGVFGLYAHTVMRGLGNTDDRTFVDAFQAIDRAIVNPLFMLTFFGALAFSGTAALLYLRDDGRSLLPWVIAAFALYLAVVVITVAVHVLLNDDIKAAGDPERIQTLLQCARTSMKLAGSLGTSFAP